MEYKKLSFNWIESHDFKVSLESPSYQKLFWNSAGFVCDGDHKKRDEEEDFVYDGNESIDDDIESDVWSSKIWSKNPELWDDTSYEIIERLNDSFLGENYLTSVAKGSANITRGKSILEHYCSRTRKKSTYIARPLWWRNPANKKDIRWFCLRCFRKSFRGKLDFPPKWRISDIIDVRNLNKFKTKYSSENENEREVQGIERGGLRLENIIRSYIKEYEKYIEFDNSVELSFFHYMPANENGYLRIAIATAIEALKNEGYDLPRKGGRRSRLGAHSVQRYCELNYIKNIGGIKAKRITFNVKTIRNIMRDKKNRHASNG